MKYEKTDNGRHETAKSLKEKTLAVEKILMQRDLEILKLKTLNNEALSRNTKLLLYIDKIKNMR